MKNLSISNFEPQSKYALKGAHVLIFLGLLVFGLGMLEITNRFLVSRYSINALNFRSFLQKKASIQVLFMGDSHLGSGVGDVPDLPKLFNLSFGGFRYPPMYYLFKRFRDEMPNLKVLILNLDLHSFGPLPQSSFEPHFFWDQYVDYHEIKQRTDAWYGSRPFEWTILSKNAGRGAFFRGLQEALKFNRPHKKILSSLRAENAEQEWRIAERPLVQSRRADSHFVSKNPLEPGVRYFFQKLLELAREKEIIVITVQLPVSRYYFERAKQYVTPAQLMDWIDSDLRSYSVKNLDYRELFFDHQEYFQLDGDHLSSRGREAFLKILFQDLQKTLKTSKIKDVSFPEN